MIVPLKTHYVGKPSKTHQENQERIKRMTAGIDQMKMPTSKSNVKVTSSKSKGSSISCHVLMYNSCYEPVS